MNRPIQIKPADLETGGGTYNFEYNIAVILGLIIRYRSNEYYIWLSIR